jgi:hypothetical protein
MKKSTLKITKTVSILAVAGLVLAGCAEPRVEEPEAFVYPIAPLTGVAYMNESEIPDTNSFPAVSCKVDNAPAGRPQFNLNKADIVHVQMVEGGLTRQLTKLDQFDQFVQWTLTLQQPLVASSATPEE